MPTIFLNKKPKLKYYYAKNERNAEIQRIYNSKNYKKLRLYYLQNNPLCEQHLKNGLYISGAEVHHKREISSGVTIDDKLKLALDYNNLQTLCLECHHKEHLKILLYL